MFVTVYLIEGKGLFLKGENVLLVTNFAELPSINLNFRFKLVNAVQSLCKRI